MVFVPYKQTWFKKSILCHRHTSSRQIHGTFSLWLQKSVTDRNNYILKKWNAHLKYEHFTCYFVYPDDNEVSSFRCQVSHLLPSSQKEEPPNPVTIVSTDVHQVSQDSVSMVTACCKFMLHSAWVKELHVQSTLCFLWPGWDIWGELLVSFFKRFIQI